MILETPLDRLRGLLAAIKGSSSLDPHAWFTHAVEVFLDGRQASLDQALGLKPGPGQRSMKTRGQIQERDALYRRAAREFFPDLRLAIHER